MDPTPRDAKKCIVLFTKKCLEYFETKEYAKIFCDIFAGVSIKNCNFFLFFFFDQKHPFQAFLISKACIFIRVKKTCIKSLCPLTPGGEGSNRTPTLRIQFFYVLPKALTIGNPLLVFHSKFVALAISQAPIKIHILIHQWNYWTLGNL